MTKPSKIWELDEEIALRGSRRGVTTVRKEWQAGKAHGIQPGEARTVVPPSLKDWVLIQIEVDFESTLAVAITKADFQILQGESETSRR